MNNKRNSDELVIEAGQRTGERDYWLSKLAGEIEKSYFPYDHKKTLAAGRKMEIVKAVLPPSLSSKMVRISKGSDVRLFAISAALLFILLHKYTGKKDLIIGAPILVSGAEAGTDFTNTVIALRARIEDDMTFKDLLPMIAKTCAEGVENQAYPMEILTSELGLSFMEGEFPLFETAVMAANIHDRSHLDRSAPGMVFSFSREDEGIRCHLEYDSSLYEAASAENIVARFIRLSETLCADAGRDIGSAGFLTSAEKNRLLYEFNDTAAAYPEGKTLHELFEEQVERTPHAVAVKDMEPGIHYLTYGLLNEKADRLARLLCERGVSGDSIVGLMMEPGGRLNTGIMAILKAGGAYLPINPVIPAGRLEYMLKDSNTKLLVTARGLEMGVSGLAAGKIEIIFIEAGIREEKAGNRDQGSGIRQKQKTGRPVGGAYMRPGYRQRRREPRVPPSLNPNVGARRAVPETAHLHLQPAPAACLAYVIYTSGSTGRPKGVGVEHRQAVNFLFHMYRHYEGKVGAGDCCLSLTNMMFDVSVWEFFLPLLFGACLVHLPGQKRFDVSALAEVILDEEITLIYIPPGLLAGVGERLEAQRGRVKLDKMLVGVEPIRDDVLEAYMRLNPGMRIINGYGPTETAICATSLDYTSHPPTGEIVSIGVPLSNNRVVLSDAAGHIVPPGITGEIYISGHGVSRGYLNNPELTAEKFAEKVTGAGDRYRWENDEKFLRSFFQKATPRRAAGGKLYKTGDLGRWLADGSIEFLGRIDQQVKIRGFRIELGEIENRLLGIPGVDEAVVLAKEYHEGDKCLCAYIVAHREAPLERSPASPDYSFDAASLREHLSRTLPGYMIPTFFIPIEKMPLNRNGKIDRGALPEPGGDHIESGVEYVPPGSRMEEIIVEALQEVLAIPRVGIDDNFFDIGGNSLNVTRVTGKLKEELGINIPLVTMFRYTTVRKLAGYLSREDRQEAVIGETVDRKNKIDEAKKRKLKKIGKGIRRKI